ncbi:MAG: hypothetical protein H6638_13080 [Ardenticatenales bacterium]|nr:hypothetical protein [Ardenticatenales bacterium]
MRLTTLDQAIRATPRDAVLWLRLGDDLSARGKLLQAREAYARASRLRPHWLIARLRLTQLPPHPVSEDAPTTATPIEHNSTEDDWFDNLGWDAIPLTPRDVDATAEATEATTNVRQVPRVAHVPPRHVVQELRTDGLELLGITLTGVGALLLSAGNGSFYVSLVGGTLLTLLARFYRREAWLRPRAPYGIAGSSALALVLLVGPALEWLWPTVPALATLPIGLPLFLFLFWLLCTLLLSLLLSR